MSQPKHAAPSGPMRGHGPGGRMMTGEKAKNFKGSTRNAFLFEAFSLGNYHGAVMRRDFYGIYHCGAKGTGQSY